MRGFKGLTMALACAAGLVTVGSSTAEAAGAVPVMGKGKPTAVSDRGVVVVRVACPRVGPACRGQAVLRHPAGRRRAVGAAGFALRPGQARRLAIRLNARGAATVARARTRTVRLELLVATRAGTRALRSTARVTLRRPAPPRKPRILSSPAPATNDRSATFRFRAIPGAVHECKLDGGRYTRCANRAVYSGLADGDHVVLVRARHRIRGLGAATRFAWRVGVPPKAPTFAAGSLATVTAGTPASVAFASATAGVTFLCSLDGGPFAVCTSPVTYRDLRPGVHTVAVKARDAAGRESAASSLSLTVVPATPALTGTPRPSTTESAARLIFTHPDPSAAFVCSLDGGPDAPCTSPVVYRGLALGAHTFTVKASVTGVLSAPATVAWTVVPLLPDVVGGIEDFGIRTIDLDDSPYDGQKGLFFATDVINIGTGPLEIRTSPTACESPEGTGRVGVQRVFRDMDGDGIFRRPADEAGSSANVIGCIAYHAAHRHQHFQEFGLYELFRFSNGRRGARVSQADKISYCMIDEKPYNLGLTSAPATPFYPYARVCQPGDDSFMGVSVGWNDQYGSDRPDQFVPLQGVPNGTYCLQVRTDYMNRLAETNDMNNDASVVVTIEGNTVSARNAVTINELRC